MDCPVCAGDCRCHNHFSADENVSVLIDPENSDVSEEAFEDSLNHSEAFEPEPPRVHDLTEEFRSLEESGATLSNPGAVDDWQQEVSRRVNGFRARRGRSQDRSMEFNFEEASEVSPTSLVADAKTVEAKIIEFPRPAESVAEDLAEPVLVGPRIFEAEEVAAAESQQQQIAASVASPPMPAIVLESQPAVENHEIELPLPVAALKVRALAAVCDAVAVVAAGLMFLFVIAATGALPQGRAGLGTMIAAGLGIWSLYQYLFVTRLGWTPGMKLFRLQLTCIDQKPVSQKLLRARALSVMLSSAPAAAGFLWALIDEDRLTWHDRITQTFLRQL